GGGGRFGGRLALLGGSRHGAVDRGQGQRDGGERGDDGHGRSAAAHGLRLEAKRGGSGVSYGGRGFTSPLGPFHPRPGMPRGLERPRERGAVTGLAAETTKGRPDGATRERAARMGAGPPH